MSGKIKLSTSAAFSVKKRSVFSCFAFTETTDSVYTWEWRISGVCSPRDACQPQLARCGFVEQATKTSLTEPRLGACSREWHSPPPPFARKMRSGGAGNPTPEITGSSLRIPHRPSSVLLPRGSGLLGLTILVGSRSRPRTTWREDVQLDPSGAVFGNTLPHPGCCRKLFIRWKSPGGHLISHFYGGLI